MEMKGKLLVTCFVVSMALLTTSSVMVENVGASGRWSNSSGKGIYRIYNMQAEPIGVAFFDVKAMEIPHPKHGYGYVRWKIDFAETDEIDVILESMSIKRVTFSIIPDWGLQAVIEAVAEILYVSSNEVVTANITVLLRDGTIMNKYDTFRIEIGDGTTITVGNLTIIDFGGIIQDDAIAHDAIDGNDSYDYIASNSNLIRGNIKIAIKTIRR
ncbi:MAG: hypothetical protein JSW60_08105 [Thermoplasmatales archaeon]|nr:MAG: hypothetical protein JSW60_08105 [Thermoplasmatales archaeon]